MSQDACSRVETMDSRVRDCHRHLSTDLTTRQSSALRRQNLHNMPATFTHSSLSNQGCSGAASPHFFQQGGRVPTPPLFWTEIRAKVSPLFQLATY